MTKLFFRKTIEYLIIFILIYCLRIFFSVKLFSDCEWLIPTEYDHYFQCQDGSFCKGFPHNLECCNSHGGRARCPRNEPVMCADKRCAGGNDHCCSVSAQQCHVDATLQGYSASGPQGPRFCGTYAKFNISLYSEIIMDVLTEMIILPVLDSIQGRH